MIGWLKGQIIDRNHPGKIVIDVNGVGYDVEMSLLTFFQLEMHDGEVGLHIHTVVREDALLLYGFLDKEERALFKSLIKVNGIGPKMALVILSSITPDEFIQCIHQQNAVFLTKLPGIGKKTAERLVVEMKDRLTHLPQTAVLQEKNTDGSLAQEEAVKALEALGYKPQEAIKAVKKVNEAGKTCEQLIRQALQLLAGH
ncbi:Holliday junction branch migration protein RuvA [Legionella oakridgensis]|uniref:Holliday junction branch migration complex subunit RuvA n=2 Tax=Legionella oakridgensis TaxID=29423 RepID=W0BGE9_9GAMM|nr:Holliday junction branch migration protein RuvA [Legionella oakridgensis]AHE67514.1 holliday junction DNA helicase, RuvA, subunit [Legionella oakridgensis ATCC 33761 = DSM 21215]ETO92899.1 holliday junction DNA helicase, subunit RuvA [Legionella oakridgensis RV-2-2007]KTD37127.1 Holliday junction DNA helicase RuvA [Legionella oakridgensis]STY20560.1 Holliday junction ATP-dependent DNA helicase RuvA [Legionella longbeachae]